MLMVDRNQMRTDIARSRTLVAASQALRNASRELRRELQNSGQRAAILEIKISGMLRTIRKPS